MRSRTYAGIGYVQGDDGVSSETEEIEYGRKYSWAVLN